MAYISKITLPSGTTYDIKDAQAWTDIADIREQLASGVSFHVCTTAADTPYGVTWINGQGTTITGTLQAATVPDKSWIYLVPKRGEITLPNDQQTFTNASASPSSITLRKYWTNTDSLPSSNSIDIYELNSVNWSSDEWKASGALKYDDVLCNATSATDASSLHIGDGTLASFYQINDATITVTRTDIYSEYIVIDQGTSSAHSYAWEKIGDTSIDLSNLGLLAFKDSASGQVSIPTSASVSGIPATFSFSGSAYSGNTGETAASDIGTVTAGSAASFTQGTFSAGTLPSIDASKFSGGSFTQGTFSAGSLPSVTDNTTNISVTSETLDLSKVLTGPFSQGSLPSHASDSFSAASIASGFFSAGTLPSHASDSFTANTPTAVTLKAHTHTVSFTPSGSISIASTGSKTVTLSTTLTTITVS